MTMPVDYQSYLLAASPPGYELNYTIRDPFPRRCEQTSFTSPNVITASSHAKIASFFQPCANYMPTVKSCPSDNLRDKEALWADNYNQDQQRTSSIPKGKIQKKSVSFADDMGGQLVQVRLLTQRPDSPPTFKPELMSSLTNGSTASISDVPLFKLNFSQPASDYIAFRDKLEHNCVALENVILKHYDLLGTVKVKNISFEKKVIIRYTTDSWDNHTDVMATYAPTTANVSVPYDTFSFKIQISPKMDTRKKLEFAIMYQASKCQYWDNNNGTNFEVMSSDWKEQVAEEDTRNTTSAVVFSLHKSSDWTEFCGWSNMTDEVPYY